MTVTAHTKKAERQALAHVAEDGRVHLLADHLAGSAERAATFAAVFGCAGWGKVAGLWHDLGKYSPAFQRKIHAAAAPDAHLEAKARVDHSTAGALCAVECKRRLGLGRTLACVAEGGRVHLRPDHLAGTPDPTDLRRHIDARAGSRCAI